MAVLYPPSGTADPFTVGADTALEDYAPPGGGSAGDWDQVVGANPLEILAANDYVSLFVWLNDELYRYQAAGAPTGDYQITCSVYSLDSASYAGICARFNTGGAATGYIIEFGGGEYAVLYKMSGGTKGSAVHTYTTAGLFPVSTFTTVIVTVSGTTTTRISVKIGAGAQEDYDDSSSPYTTGHFGLYGQVDGGDYARFDNLLVEDVGGGPVSTAATVRQSGRVRAESTVSSSAQPFHAIEFVAATA